MNDEILFVELMYYNNHMSKFSWWSGNFCDSILQYCS